MAKTATNRLQWFLDRIDQMLESKYAFAIPAACCVHAYVFLHFLAIWDAKINHHEVNFHGIHFSNGHYTHYTGFEIGVKSYSYFDTKEEAEQYKQSLQPNKQ